MAAVGAVGADTAAMVEGLSEGCKTKNMNQGDLVRVIGGRAR